ncbi:MAG: protocatechuate dioxygenase [Planctomycetota bacterium]
MNNDFLPPDSQTPAVDRRQLLRGVGLAGAGAALAGSLTPTQLAAAARATQVGAGAPAGLQPLLTRIGAPSAVLGRVCTLTPQQTEGPYYLNNRLTRQDITEGRPGLELWLFYLVVHADCSPAAGAVVDVWHAEALGVYSGFSQQGTAGQTWMRGGQTTDGNGLVAFRTLYPGWYPGRATHVHVKVHLQNSTVLTTQTYFDDPLTTLVYDNIAPYTQRGSAGRTLNTRDGIYDARNQKVIHLNPAGGLSLWAGMIIGIA